LTNPSNPQFRRVSQALDMLYISARRSLCNIEQTRKNCWMDLSRRAGKTSQQRWLKVRVCCVVARVHGHCGSSNNKCSAVSERG